LDSYYLGLKKKYLGVKDIVLSSLKDCGMLGYKPSAISMDLNLKLNVAKLVDAGQY